MAGSLTGRPAAAGAHALVCLVCGGRFGPGEVDYLCPDHGQDGVMDIVYDHPALAAQVSRDEIAGSSIHSMWRYRALLPVGSGATVPPLRVGWTPLVPADRLAAHVGVRQLWVKDEGLQPTGSLKDRASAMAVAKASERGASVIATASTGNAAAALAGVCASVGQECVVFVPASAPPAKVAQLACYGATVLLVDGTYDDAFSLCTRAAAHHGWYNRNTGFNPYMTEGKKTVAYEICEQLGWRAPDVVVVPVGDGCILGGVHKGLADLLALGWIDRMPRLIGVQADGSSYLADAWAAGEDVLTKPPIVPDTIADSISAGLPRDRLKAIRAVEESRGALLSVPDDEILRAIPLLARTTGVLAEPAAAAACAGLAAARAQGLVANGDEVVLLSTGTGLKDVPAISRGSDLAGTRVHRVAADLDAVARAVG